MKKYNIMLIILFLISLVGVVIYNVYDNNRVVLVKEEISIKDLPESFEGFTILQLSDLHEKRFGENQKDLINMINNLNYDMIAITGDMYSINSKDDKPFLELLDGIKNKEYMFYVSGNHGPKFSDKLEARGCIDLYKPYEIKRDGDSMLVYDFYDGKKFSDDVKNYDSDVVIGVTHYPWNESFYLNAESNIGSYDLVLAGHYHGGQVRIPFYGALFVPNLNDAGFFPNQYDVSGLQDYGSYKQYISRGLGASSGSDLTRFRLFNSPEINLIKLVRD